MAEFPTYEQMAKDIADKALDEYLINGKTLREWITIIAEQEPCEDCISRAEALRQTKEWRDGEFLRVTSPYYYLEKRLNDLPSVKLQEPKTGHWIEHFDNGGRLHHLECSCCHNWHRDYYKDKYCPNCGAKMESEVTI